MKNKSELFDSFKNSIQTAKAIENEWSRLEGIEVRLKESLAKNDDEIQGLIRAEGMSSINYEARSVIERQRKLKEIEHRQLCKFLGIDPTYKEQR